MTDEGIQAQQYEPSSSCPEFILFPKKCQKESSDMSPDSGKRLLCAFFGRSGVMFLARNTIDGRHVSCEEETHPSGVWSGGLAMPVPGMGMAEKAAAVFTYAGLLPKLGTYSRKRRLYLPGPRAWPQLTLGPNCSCPFSQGGPPKLPGCPSPRL